MRRSPFSIQTARWQMAQIPKARDGEWYHGVRNGRAVPVWLSSCRNRATAYGRRSERESSTARAVGACPSATTASGAPRWGRSWWTRPPSFPTSWTPATPRPCSATPPLRQDAQHSHDEGLLRGGARRAGRPRAVRGHQGLGDGRRLLPGALRRVPCHPSEPPRAPSARPPRAPRRPVRRRVRRSVMASYSAQTAAITARSSPSSSACSPARSRTAARSWRSPTSRACGASPRSPSSST